MVIIKQTKDFYSIDPVNDIITSVDPIDPVDDNFTSVDPKQQAQTTSPRAKPLGLGKPLSLRIISAYPGPHNHDQLLVASAVKSAVTYDQEPLAIHHVVQEMQGGRLLQSRGDVAGTNIVYHSPVVTESSLDVTLRFAYDDFDLEKWIHWTDVAYQAAKLPAFAVPAVLGVGGPALLYFANQTVKLALDAVDRRIDGHNDVIASGTLSINPDISGLEATPAGYLLFTENGSPEQVLATGLDLFKSKDKQTLAPLSTRYRVDPVKGRLVEAERPHAPVLGDRPYFLTWCTGTSDAELQKWTKTAVSAALAKKFLATTGSMADDMGALLAAYSNYKMATGYLQAKAELATSGLSADERAELERQRDSYLKRIDDPDLKRAITDEK